ncbi:hypothetical protein SAMN02745166_02676 [Prosthecobacter debontii]|uniref:Uncharacterized protein n=1 Tax=Prosthecobacter debontii TaxID=48467 RepID=A0A1T4Y9Y6_9BACT|nr:hypothetical protein SAMN02745166_02676 [Prosthecobacter debontii]
MVVPTATTGMRMVFMCVGAMVVIMPAATFFVIVSMVMTAGGLVIMSMRMMVLVIMVMVATAVVSVVVLMLVVVTAALVFMRASRFAIWAAVIMIMALAASVFCSHGEEIEEPDDGKPDAGD